MCARSRKLRGSRARAGVTSRSSNIAVPDEAGRSRRMRRASVLFPEPDSPTRPTVWPRLMEKVTSSTATRHFVGRPKKSRISGNLLVRPLTSSRDSALEGRGVVAAELMLNLSDFQRRVFLIADRDPIRAAGGKTARGRQGVQLAPASA